MQYNPKNRTFINEVREACHLLRTTGAKWIHERKTAIQNGDDVPKDILTQIIKSAGEGTLPVQTLIDQIRRILKCFRVVGHGSCKQFQCQISIFIAQSVEKKLTKHNKKN